MSTQVNGHSAAPQANGIEGGSKISAHEVGFQFVPQYYNFVNKNPERLHCFYTKRSHFSHGLAGDEKNTTAHGQAEIHQRILDLAYNQCKVWINSIDSQSSDRGGIIILVLGEISNNEGDWRKFAQTFFLAEQPNGYFVLNDIFRYLRDDDDEEVEEPAPAQPDLQNQPSIEVSAPAAAEEEQAESVPAALEAAAAEPVREEAVTIAAPELPNGSTTVPEEAVVAAVPDKDVAPEEAPVIEEPAAVEVEAPVEAAEPQAEASSASAPAPAASPAPSAPAPQVNGNAPPAPAAAAPVTTPAPPAAPAKPKSWAALAAANAPKPAWGSVAAAPAPPAAQPTPPPAAATAAAAPKPAEPTPAASGSASQQRHPYYENALKITTPQCFVKLPNWSIENPTGGESMDETTLKAVAARFGEVKKVEIVKAKACAFVEFATLDGAKKAIIASLLPSQGGEGGVKYGEGKLNFETRKEKDERRPKGPTRGASEARGGGRGGARVHVGGREGGEGQVNGGAPRGDAAGRGRGRGRGGAAAAGGDRPAPRQ